MSLGPSPISANRLDSIKTNFSTFIANTHTVSAFQHNTGSNYTNNELQRPLQGSMQ